MVKKKIKEKPMNIVVSMHFYGLSLEEKFREFRKFLLKGKHTPAEVDKYFAEGF